MKCVNPNARCGHDEVKHRLVWDHVKGRHVRLGCFEVEINQLGMDISCNCGEMVYAEPEKLLTIAEAAELLKGAETSPLTLEQIAAVNKTMAKLGADLRKTVDTVMVVVNTWLNGIKPQLDLFQRAIAESGALVELANKMNARERTTDDRP